MNKNIWKIWLVAGLGFLVAGIAHIVDGNNLLGITYISLAITYAILSRSYYNADQNPIEISAGDFDTMNSELQKLIADGKSIQAVKLCRQVTGWGLKEAKDHVDALTEHKEK